MDQRFTTVRLRIRALNYSESCALLSRSLPEKILRISNIARFFFADVLFFFLLERATVQSTTVVFRGRSKTNTRSSMNENTPRRGVWSGRTMLRCVVVRNASSPRYREFSIADYFRARGSFRLNHSR